MSGPNIARTNLPLTTRMLNGLRNLFSISQHRLAQSYPRLTVQDLFRPLPLNELIQLNQLLASEVGASTPAFSRQGALLRLNADRDTIVVGDLHGNTARLDRILQEFGPRLAAGENLVCLGDIIHPESAGRVGNMESSLQTLNTVIRLKQLFPDRVHLLLGNHDEIQPNFPDKMIVKRGVPQGVIFNIQMREFFASLGHTEPEVRRIMAAYQSFFDGCALSAVIEGGGGSTFLAHSAVIRGGVTTADLAGARGNGLMLQLLWNSPGQARVGSRESYGEADVAATAQRLNLRGGAARTYLVSGHTPDESNWVYRPFAGLNHYVLHGNVENSFGVLVVQNGTPQGYQITVDPAIAARS